MVIVSCYVYVNMCEYARDPWINTVYNKGQLRYEDAHCWMKLKCSKKEAIFTCNIGYIGKCFEILKRITVMFVIVVRGITYTR